MGFSFKDNEIAILKNFASINPSMIFNPNRFEVKNFGNSVIGYYPFENEYNFEMFGIYDVNNFLQAISAMDSPEIEVFDKYLQIYSKDKSSKLTYYTTATSLIEKVPDISNKFEQVECNLEFSISNEKLSLLTKMSSIIGSEYIFFETDGKKIRITISNDLNSSSNDFNITIEDNIKKNSLESPVKLILSDFKVLPGDYEVKISSKISKWSNLNGVTYYIASSAA